MRGVVVAHRYVSVPEGVTKSIAEVVWLARIELLHDLIRHCSFYYLTDKKKTFIDLTLIVFKAFFFLETFLLLKRHTRIVNVQLVIN